MRGAASVRKRRRKTRNIKFKHKAKLAKQKQRVLRKDGKIEKCVSSR